MYMYMYSSHIHVHVVLCLTLEYGIPVDVLNAGSSLSPTVLAIPTS